MKTKYFLFGDSFLEKWSRLWKNIKLMEKEPMSL